LCIDGPTAYDLTHHGIEGQPVGVVDILVACQPPIDRLPDSPSSRWTVFFPVRLSRSAADARPDKPSASSRIELAHHHETTVRAELRTSKFQPHAWVEIHPICPLRTRTRWVIHETHPSQPSTP
jgi:hypothetical protein